MNRSVFAPHGRMNRIVSFILTVCLVLSLATPAVAAANMTYCGQDHDHTLACYSNPLADVETAKDWEQTLPEQLSDNWRQALLAVVQSQLGYRESSDNYLVEADGVTCRGYSRYGGWYSSFLQDAAAAYADWNVTFLFFSLYYAGVSDLPLEETCGDWTAALAAYSLLEKPSYVPVAGDLAFLDTNGDGEADRAGVVSAVEADRITLIEGDLDGAVAEASYDRAAIFAYGNMGQAQADAQPENGDAETLNNTTFTIYFAAPASWTSYTIKANVCRSNGENNWQQVNMTNTGKTYTTGGTTYYLYSASVTEIYGGFDQIQFQRYSGSAWQEQYVANSSWVTKDTINGKMYIKGTGWVTYAEDATEEEVDTYVTYFAAPQGWASYTIKANVHTSSSSGENWFPYTMEDTGYTYIHNNVTYNVYKAEVGASGDGIYEFQFQRYSGADWKEQYVAYRSSAALSHASVENKLWVLDSAGATTGEWIDYTPGSTGGEVIPPSDDNRYVFYDATLSKLAYASNNNANYTETMPKSGAKMYCHWWIEGSGSSATVEMTNVPYGTWKDVYRAEVPDNATHVLFFSSSSSSSWPSETSCARTVNLKLSDSVNAMTYPCFYGDSSDSAMYDGGARNGYWGEVYNIRDAESGKSSDVVDITQEAFSANTNALYLETTFFDFYTDFELNGSNRDDYPGEKGVSFRNWYTFRHLNQALSEYYEVDTVKYPLYVGHFQPDSNYYDFKDVASTLSLYGYAASGDLYKRFFASNNSIMDEGGTWEKTQFAMQGLVSPTLKDGKLMSHGGSQEFPLFNKDFILGTNSKNTVLGQVYESVSFPFVKQAGNGGVQYWTFDSNTMTMEMRQDPNTDEYYLKNVGTKAWAENLSFDSTEKNTNGFFPFNSGSTQHNANTYNYGYGVRIDLNFRLTEDAKVDGNDIVFEFSGDDDVWVFIDGKLALDVGGGHEAVTGRLNFATLKATVDKVKYGGSATTQYEPRTTDFTLEGKNTDQHTLTMFYMERGMWESNMKITFNFPDENLLEVGKEVDDSKVNDLFDGVFDDQSLFTFNIKNLATHYGTKLAAGATYDVAVIDPSTATYQATYTGNSFTLLGEEFAEKTDVIQWYADLNDDTSAWRHRRYGLMTLAEPIDVRYMRSLSFYIYTADGCSLDDLYIQLVDEDATIEQLTADTAGSGDENACGCIGSDSSFAAKTYGAPDLSVGNQWVRVSLDLSKFDFGTSMSPSRIKYLRFGSDVGENIYLCGFEFEAMAVEDTSAGFVTDQRDIADYGSAQSGVLEIPEGAVYSSSLNGKSYLIGSEGIFVLQNGETVSFHDQFRRGSYIYLEEVMSAQAQALFDTTWTMYENGAPVTTFGGGSNNTYITNPGTTPSMMNVPQYVVRDNRTEKVISTYASGNVYNGVAPQNSFVFRSYANPGNTTTAAKLKVVFTNAVNTGSLTISKEQTSGSASLDGNTYTFLVEFYNVGGLGLETKQIVETVTLEVGQSHTIDGIPLGTNYRIYEVKPTDGSTLDYVTSGGSTVTSTAGSIQVDGTTYDGFYVSGTVTDEADTAYAFYNAEKPVVSVTVNKVWSNTTSETVIPNVIYLQLQRKVSGGSWSAVAGYETVALQGGYDGWSYVFTNLDRYNNFASSSRKEYSYRVREVDAEGNVIESGSVVGGQFTVSYTDSGGSATAGYTRKITNTWIPTATLSITKKLDTLASGSWLQDTFRIYVTLDGEPIGIGTAYTVDGTAYQVSTEGMILLTAGQTAEIRGIAAGTVFTVSEPDSLISDYQATYTGTVTDNSSTVTAATATALQISGTLTTGSEGRVTVTNRNRGNHIVVIDYGIPVHIDVMNEDLALQNGSLLNVSGETPNGSVTTSGNTIIYTPGDMLMEQETVLTYRIRYSVDGVWSTYTSTVTIVPATVIYYEDGFAVLENGTSTSTKTGLKNHGKWSPVGTADSDAFQQDNRVGVSNLLDPSNVYGYDPAYTGYATYSLGSANMVTVSANNNPSTTVNPQQKAGSWPTATFTFTGTGFDIISLTDSDSGMITVDVYKGEVKKANRVAGLIVDNYYGYNYVNGQFVPAPSDSDALYQVPVIKLAGLDYGTYTAVITPKYATRYDHDGTDGAGDGQYSFWLDAIRIYNPAGLTVEEMGEVVSGAYNADNELFPTYTTVKQVLVDAGSFNASASGISGVLFADGNLNVGANTTTAAHVALYKNAGPNNEVYLKNGQGLGFRIQSETKPAEVHLAVKLACGTSANVVVTAAGHPDDVSVSRQITGATDLYMDITSLLVWETKTVSGKTYYVTKYPITVASASASSAMVSVTNLKYTFGSAVASESSVDTIVDDGDAPLVYAALRKVMAQAAAEQVFVPKTFGASFVMDQVTVGTPAVLTVETSADVAQVTVNGEAAVLLRTDATTGVSTWTYLATAAEAGTFTYDVTAYDAAGTASDPYTVALTVAANS